MRTGTGTEKKNNTTQQENKANGDWGIPAGDPGSSFTAISGSIPKNPEVGKEKMG